MKAPELPRNEQERLAALHRSALLDTVPEERFDRYTRMACRIFRVPIALVSLVDQNRQWFKSCQGLTAPETPRDISFCGHAILHSDIFVIEDTLNDDRLAIVIGQNRQRLKPKVLVLEDDRKPWQLFKKRIVDLSAANCDDFVVSSNPALSADNPHRQRRYFRHASSF